MGVRMTLICSLMCVCAVIDKFLSKMHGGEIEWQWHGYLTLFSVSLSAHIQNQSKMS